MAAAPACDDASWRYFRVLAPYARSDRDAEMQWLRRSWSARIDAATEKALEEGLSPVEWLPWNVYRIPKHIFISQSSLHKDGQIVGMDAASVASIVALDVTSGDGVLDVCCCPGMKLKLISELVKGVKTSAVESAEGGGGGALTAPHPQQRQQEGVAVGVDISVGRLFVARSLMSRLGATNLILAHCDGTAYTPASLESDIALRRPPAKQKAHLQRLHARSAAALSASDVTGVWCSDDLQARLIDSARHLKRPREEAGADAGEPAVLASPITIPRLYDRVLVDAECTHDGSLHHIVPQQGGAGKADGSGSLSFQDSLHKYKPNYALHTEEGDDTLHELQYRLLERGYALTRPGGYVVYSTCSFSEGQNEAIVRRFLKAYGGDAGADGRQGTTAVLTPPFGDSAVSVGAWAESVARLAGIADVGVGGVGVRMNPSRTQSSFQYIAKIHKQVV